MSEMQAISGRTALLGIIGDPIEQARAPGLVNPVLEARGIDAILVPMQVEAGRLGRAIDGLRAIDNFRGAIVTMPHKRAIMALLDDISPEGMQASACNVLRRDGQGRLSGTMLDGEGFAAGLLGAGHAIRGKRVFLAGAGGAASAIAFALARQGAAALTTHNRTQQKAAELVGRIRAAHPNLEVSAGGPSPAGADIVVNATSIGMKEGDGLPLDPSGLAPGMLAADVMSHRETTAFLAEAARRGCRTHPGLPMLERQIELMIDFMLA
jgi:shikimate dehydrogenase